MGPLLREYLGIALGLPRVSGDGPFASAHAKWAVRAAPRERGWALAGYDLRRIGDGCPA